MVANDLPYPRPLVLAAASAKGGQGKDTILAHLGDVYRQQGFKVLYIDLDPVNASAEHQTEDPASFSGIEEGKSASQALLGKTTSSLLANVVPGPQGYDVIKASFGLHDLAGMGFAGLRPQIGGLGTRYDMVLINTAAGWTQLTMAAYWAADISVTPVTARHPKSRESLWQIEHYLASNLRMAKDRWRIVLNEVEYAEESLKQGQEVRARYPNTLATELPKTTLFKKLEEEGRSIGSGKAWERARQPLTQLSKELLDELHHSRFTLQGLDKIMKWEEYCKDHNIAK